MCTHTNKHTLHDERYSHRNRFLVLLYCHRVHRNARASHLSAHAVWLYMLDEGERDVCAVFTRMTLPRRRTSTSTCEMDVHFPYIYIYSDGAAIGKVHRVYVNVYFSIMCIAINESADNLIWLESSRLRGRRGGVHFANFICWYFSIVKHI